MTALIRSKPMVERAAGSAEPRPATDGWVPATDADRNSARSQLAKMLAHPLFANSKRYPTLLRHVVECSLDGKIENLKERTLGIEVFGRKADYDTNLDPVVRITAGEIRKRIAQYYHDPEHESELRIDLPPGSYVPLFHLPHFPQTNANGGQEEGYSSAHASAMVLPSPARARRWTSLWLPASVCVFAAAVIVVVSMRPWSPRTALDQFWSPILNAPGPVLLSIGEPSIGRSQNGEAKGSPAVIDNRGTIGNRQTPVNQDAQRRSPAANREAPGPAEETISEHIRLVDHIVLPDATALVNISGFLGRSGKPYHLQGTSSTTLTDLRQGPAILISAFDNPWTLRLTDPLRFHFVRRPGSSVCSIEDREDPSGTPWSIDFSTPYSKLAEDYGIVARFWDSTTGQQLVIAAGISTHGTISAGEFLTDNRFIQELLDRGPNGSTRKNIEAVIATQVIDGKSGPPRLAALHSW